MNCPGNKTTSNLFTLFILTIVHQGSTITMSRQPNSGHYGKKNRIHYDKQGCVSGKTPPHYVGDPLLRYPVHGSLQAMNASDSSLAYS